MSVTSAATRFPVIAWVARKGAVCPEPRYPGSDAMARLVAVRNEVWESPYRPSP